MFAAGTHTGKVRLVDATTGTVRWDVQTNVTDLRAVVVPPDGSFVVCVGASEENWQLLDAFSGDVRLIGARHDGTGPCLCNFTRSGRSLDSKCPVLAHTEGLQALAVSQCGHRVATGGDDASVILWDTRTGRAELVLVGHDDGIVSLSFSADGVRLASGSYDGSIRVWDAVTGALQATITEPHLQSPVASLQFSPVDNRKLLSRGVIDFKEWELSLEIGGTVRMNRYYFGNSYAVYSPDGRCVCAGQGGGVWVVDLATSQTTSRMGWNPADAIARCVDFSIDGRTLVAGHQNGDCRVWDVYTRARLFHIEGEGVVVSVCWGRGEWVRGVGRNEAFGMGHHPRIGAGSLVLGLDEELLRLILGRV